MLQQSDFPCGSVVVSTPACGAEGPGFEAGSVQSCKLCVDHESCRITVHGHKHCEPANCLGQLSLLPVTGMVNEYSFGWVRAASDSSVGNSRHDYVRGINMHTYLLTLYSTNFTQNMNQRR